jgi:DNA-directed RNA polymerase subunit H
MDKYMPADVYDNLIKLLSYRNLTLTSEKLLPQKLSEALNNYEYVIISGSREATDIRGEARAKIVLIAPNSKYANKSPEFKKLIKALMKDTGFNELMFVSEQPLTIHIIKYLDEFKKENKNIYVEEYEYSMFGIEKPAHVMVPKHIIMSQKEVDEFCYKYYTAPKNQQHIYSGDPQAVWIGLRPGMMCRVLRLSETAGEAIAYKYCIPGSVNPI